MVTYITLYETIQSTTITNYAANFSHKQVQNQTGYFARRNGGISRKLLVVIMWITYKSGTLNAQSITRSIQLKLIHFQEFRTYTQHTMHTYVHKYIQVA